MQSRVNAGATKWFSDSSLSLNHILFRVSHRTTELSYKKAASECAVCVCFPEKYGGGGGGHGPGGLEGQVYGPGGAAHEVQNANHQDPRPDC